MQPPCTLANPGDARSAIDLSPAPLRNSNLHFVAWRTSIPSAASGIFGIRFPPRAVGMFSMGAVNSKSAVSVVGSPLLFSVWCIPAVVRWGEGMVSLAGACRVALLHSTAGRREGASASLCCDHFQVAIHVNPFRPDGVHRIQEAVPVQVWHVNNVHLMFRSQWLRIIK